MSTDQHLPANSDAEMNDAGCFNRYQLIRNEIAHEDNLMGARIGWFTSSQAFLLTALVIAQGNRTDRPMLGNNYLFPMVPVIAIASDILILVGVMAGMEVLRRWRIMLADYTAFPRVRKDRWLIGFGWAAPVGLPLVFLAAWIYVLIAGTRSHP